MKKTIIVVCGAGMVSGKEKIMLLIMRGLKENGYNIFCITSFWCHSDFEILLNKYQISFVKLRLGFISKTFDAAAIRMTLHQLIHFPLLLVRFRKVTITQKPFAIIHSNFHHLFLLYPALSKKYRNIYHSHESISNSNFYKKLFHLFNNKIDWFVSVSHYVTNKMKLLGLPEEKLITIQNGIYEPSAQTNQGNQTVKQNSNTFNIGIIGQITDWKGHEDLIKALALLNSDIRKKIKLYIFGKGIESFIQSLKSLITQLRLEDIIIWKGYIKNRDEIYSILNLVCIPSRSEEPFATSALEPGIYSIPVIVTDRGGLPEIVEDGINGWVVPMQSPEIVAAKIEWMLEHPTECINMGKEHHKKLVNLFTYRRFVNDWIHLISKTQNN
ncbi:MAG: hypothetical protein C0459_04505 [Chitinophaga sp.]|jgi:glycosyltransferase involved in cell wall biosynthesis|nr:hypothetical protein [Chitinophaga sp.]